jgi:hypothetical protein
MPLFHRDQRSFCHTAYNHNEKMPAIRASICTGEKVAGFRDKKTGHFEDVILIRSDKDLEEFRNHYGITEEIPVFY